MAKGKKRGGGGSKNKHNKGGGGRPGNKKNDSQVVAKKKVSKTPFPISGLMNLGNTCFFNSVMQSIAQTHCLRHHLNDVIECTENRLELTAKEQKLEVIVSGPPGVLTKTLHTFMSEMITHSGQTINPRPLFTQICDKAPCFRGYQPQDSQELLRYLLDSLKTEEIHRIKRSVLLAFNVKSGKTSAIGQLTENVREKIKLFGNAAHQVPTFVDTVFGGSLVSTITCKECHNCSTLQESYLDLSIPIPRDKSVTFSSPGGGNHQLRDQSSKKNKGRKNTRPSSTSNVTVTNDDDDDGETSVLVPKMALMDDSKSTTMSKYQMKKARKHNRKNIKHSLKDLKHVLSQQNDEEDKRDIDDDRDDGDNQKDDVVVVTENEKREGENEMIVEEDEGPEREGEIVELTEEGEDHDGGYDASESEAGEESEEERGERGDGREDEIVNKRAHIETETAVVTVDELSDVCSENIVPIDNETENIAVEIAEKSTKSAQNLNKDNPPQVSQPPENDGTDKTVNDASPRQPENATPTTDMVSSFNDCANETSSPLNSEECKDETTPTLNGVLSPLTTEIASENHLPSHSTPENYREDSIEGCLMNFCSVEVLTEGNQIFCFACTQQEANKEAALKVDSVKEDSRQPTNVNMATSLERSDREPTSREMAEKQAQHEATRSPVPIPGNMENRERDHEIEPQPSIPNHTGTDVPECDPNSPTEPVHTSPDSTAVNDDGPGLTQEHTNLPSEKISKEGTEEMNESTSIVNQSTVDGEMSAHESQDEESVKSNSDCSSEKEQTSPSNDDQKQKHIFCDATKQLLIKSLPPVLTLHLKRFLQDGQKLRKNGRHIEFPDVLDMTPYCVPDCKAPHDEDGRRLYSLYAVVEHSGGMQRNGHYTAFVRWRNHTHLTTVGGASNDTSVGCKQNDGVSRTDAMATVGACSTDSGTTDRPTETTSDHYNHNHTTDDHLLTNNKDHIGSTTTDQTVTTPNQNGSTRDETDTTSDQRMTTPTTNSTTIPQIHPKINHTPSNSTTLQLDHHSATTGEWYHISDTHARTSTHTEVHKSQAYLLFYEILPLKES